MESLRCRCLTEKRGGGGEGDGGGGGGNGRVGGGDVVRPNVIGRFRGIKPSLISYQLPVSKNERLYMGDGLGTGGGGREEEKGAEEEEEEDAVVNKRTTTKTTGTYISRKRWLVKSRRIHALVITLLG